MLINKSEELPEPEDKELERIMSEIYETDIKQRNCSNIRALVKYLIKEKIIGREIFDWPFIKLSDKY